MMFHKTLAKAMGLKVWEFRLMLVMGELKNALERDIYRALEHEDPMDGDNQTSSGPDDRSFSTPAERDAYWSAIQKKRADDLGQFIAAELLKKNYQVLRIAAAGWENLNSGKPFKKQAGRLRKRICVYHEWVNLVMSGNLRPSMDEILAKLASRKPPVKIAKGQLSSWIDELGMKGWLRDTRRAKNTASGMPSGDKLLFKALDLETRWKECADLVRRGLQ